MSAFCSSAEQAAKWASWIGRATVVAIAILTPPKIFAAERMNVLFIAVDDLRPELGCYGADHIRSPHLDQLASRAVRFDRAYCQYAICGPSRASLLTGLRPDTLEIEDIDTFFRRTVPDVVTLPQHFKAHGYTTRYVGKVFHPRQEDNDVSWSAPPPAIGRPGGEYQLPASREIVQRRRAEAAARYGADRIEGLTGGPVSEAADMPDEAYPDGRIAEAGARMLRELRTRPFFLAVGFHKPHLPFVAPKKYFDLYDPARMPLAAHRRASAGAPTVARHSSFELRTRAGVPQSGPIDDASARELRRAYAACVSFIDAQIGRLLAELDGLGLRDRTIVIVWGDHGWHLGELGLWGKATNYEVATRVPLLVAVPGRTAGGQVSRALVEFVDLYPTLCDVTGLPRPAHLEGTSFATLLADPARPWKRAAFSQFPAPALREWAARPLTPGMRETRFGPVIAGVEARLAGEHGSRFEREVFERHVMGYSLRSESHRFTAWIDRRKPDDEPLALELYDHERDPNETENLAGHPEQRELVARLRAQLRAGWQSALPPD